MEIYFIETNNIIHVVLEHLIFQLNYDNNS